MKPTVLAVDDENAIRHVFKNFLTREGYDVVAVEDYDSAIEQLSKSEILCSWIL